jgi:hypothetical protein
MADAVVKKYMKNSRLHDTAKYYVLYTVFILALLLVFVGLLQNVGLFVAKVIQEQSAISMDMSFTASGSVQLDMQKPVSTVKLSGSAEGTGIATVYISDSEGNRFKIYEFPEPGMSVSPDSPASTTLSQVCADTCGFGPIQPPYSLVVSIQGDVRIHLTGLDIVTTFQVAEDPSPAIERQLPVENVFETIQNIIHQDQPVPEQPDAQLHIEKTKAIQDIIIRKNSYTVLNASEYFSGAAASYSAFESENMTITISSELVTITPIENWTGTSVGRVTAHSEDMLVDSNQFNIIVHEQNLSVQTAQQQRVRLGSPVKWKKTIQMENPENLTIALPHNVENITVKKIVENQSQSMTIQNITNSSENSPASNESAANQTGTQANAATEEIGVSSTNESALLNQTNAQSENMTANATIIEAVITGNMVGADDGIFTKIYKFFASMFLSFTGRVVDGLQTTEEVTEVIIDDTATSYEIEYETPAPYAEETEHANSKTITVIGPEEFHYTDIIAFTELPREVNGQAVRLYWLTNNTKVEINTTKFDLNSNGFIDYIEWDVPSLSNQTYELNISVLNVHSEPSLYGNWTVYFNTAGTANLTITATNDPNYTAEYTRWNNQSEDGYDLKFLEVKCGNEILDYEWQGGNCAQQECSVYIPDYSCSQTATEISKVLTAKKHVLKFSFGGQTEYAYNDVINTTINFTAPTPPNNTQTGLLFVNMTSSANSSSSAFLDFNYTLFGWYRMNGEAGENSTDIADWSSWQNNLSCSGTNCPTWNASGRYAGAFTFDGSNDRFKNKTAITNNIGNLSAGFTFSAWINPANVSATTYRTIIYKGETTKEANLMLYGDEIYTDVDGGGYVTTSDQDIPVGSWTHVAATWDNDKIRVYKNGTLAGTSASTTFPSGGAGSLFIGSYGGTQYYFNGTIDDVMVFNRTLTANEMLSLYNATANQYYSQIATINNGVTYQYQGIVQDISGNVNVTEIRQATINTSNITTCGDLGGANAAYKLTQNVSSANYCFSINATNITLDCQNNNITYGTAGLDNSYAVRIGSANSSVTNCKIYEGNSSGSTRYAIRIAASQFNISNNIINTTGAGSHAIYFQAKSNSNITNNTIQTGYATAQRAISADAGTSANITATDNIIINPSFGFYIVNGLKWTIARNTITALSYSIYSEGTSNHTIENNTFNQNSTSHALWLVNLNGTKINNNTINQIVGGTSVVALYMQSAGFWNNITNNRINAKDSTGILTTTGNSRFENNTIFVNASSCTHCYGIRVGTSNLTFLNENITTEGNGTATMGQGVVFTASNTFNINFNNSYINAKNTADIYINTTVNNGTWTFINTTHSDRNFTAGANGTLVVGWYVTVNVTNTSGSPVVANVTVNDTFGNSIFNETTGSNGFTSQYLIYEVNQTNSTGNASQNPHKITATNASYSDYINNSVNMSYSGFYNVLVLTAEEAAPPRITIVSPANMTYNSAISFNTSSNEPLGSCKYTLNSWAANTTMSGFNSTYYYNTTTVSSDGAYTARFWCSDIYGIVNSTESIAFTVDTIPPNITINLPTNTTYSNSTITINITNSSDANTVWWNNGTNNQTYANMTTQSFSEGNHTIIAYANDSSNNINRTNITFTVDTTPPSVTIISPVGATSTNTTITINITNSSDANTVWWSNGTNNQTYTNVTTGVFSIGNHMITAYANDSFNNINQTSVTFTVSSPSGETITTSSGGDGGALPEKKAKINLSSKIISLKGTVGLLSHEELAITSTDNKEQTIVLSLQNMEGIIRFNKTKFTIKPAETLRLKYDVIPPNEPGVYTGKILISSGSGKAEEIEFILNVQSYRNLFDVFVNITNESKTISSDEALVAQIILVQFGSNEKTDVTINYYIKDFNGTLYFNESETIMVFTEKTYKKEFRPQWLQPGNYVLGIEAVYPGGVATASSQFNIEKPIIGFFGPEIENAMIIALIAMALSAAVLLAFVAATKKYRKTAGKHRSGKPRTKHRLVKNYKNKNAEFV